MNEQLATGALLDSKELSDTAVSEGAEISETQTTDGEDPKAQADRVIRPDGVLSRPVLVCLLILTVLAVLGALYLGQDVILPIVLAVVLKLLLQPIVDVLCDKLRVPKPVSALLLILLLFGSIAAVVFAVSQPAAEWIQRAPEILPTFREKLVPLRQPIEYIQQALKEIQDIGSGAGSQSSPPPVKVTEPSAIGGTLARGVVSRLAFFFTTMVMLFFLLGAGDRLLKGLIEVLPRFSDKRRAVEIASEIQRNIGGYLITISVMNTLVGIATGLAMWGCGLGAPILWGSLAFVLNYVPILGPLTGIGIFLVAGILALDWPWYALLPAASYTMIHVAEGEVI